MFAFSHSACDNECYAGTGAWEGNCFSDGDMCNGEATCQNLMDEANCTGRDQFFCYDKVIICFTQ